MVDVCVGNDDIGDLGRRSPELGKGGGNVFGDRPVDAGVDEQEPFVADDEPLGKPPRPEDRGDPVDARLNLFDTHGSPRLITTTRLSPRAVMCLN